MKKTGSKSTDSFRIQFETPHGNRVISYPDIGLTLRRVLKLAGIPVQAVSLYGVSGSDGPELFVGLDEQVVCLRRRYNQIIVRPDRNIDYFSLVERTIKVRRCETAVSEYSFCSNDSASSQRFEFSQEDCLRYVANEVEAFLANQVKVNSGQRVVLGVSGGGDSNALMHSFMASGCVTADQLLAVMIMGIPDWDRGKERA